MDRLSFEILWGMRAARLGVIWSAFLVVIKVLGGILGHSSALIADGIESAFDVLMSMIVWQGLRASGKNPNEDFHFGLGKAEPLSAAIVSVLMMGAGLCVGIVAVRSLAEESTRPSWFTLPILVLVIVIKELLARKVSVVGEKISSVSIKNDALHHRTDVITSSAAFIGILIALAGGPDWYGADGVAALFCAAVISKNGLTMFREASYELLDKAPDESFLNAVVSAATSVPDVVVVEKVLARKAGLAYFVALHVHARPDMSLHDAHIVSGKVKTAIKKSLPAVRDVLVHMEPAEASTGA